MPDLHHRGAQRRVVVAGKADAELQRRAVAVLDDVAAFWLRVAVVRAFVLLGPQPARAAPRDHRHQFGAHRIGSVHVLANSWEANKAR